MNAIAWAPLILYLVELTIKIVALGTVPNNRRPSSSIAWLLLIVVTPILGLAIFLLIGSPFVRGRRAKVQAEANKIITERTAEVPDLPAGADIPVGVDSLFRLNRALTQLPCVTGVSHGLFGDYDASIKAMAETVNQAESTVHVEFFITAWDDTTDIFCTALAEAVKRGVKVRLLYDDIASRGYPGFKQLNTRLTAAGIEWHEMMPIKPFKGKWRRPDLRNHRKLLVVDSKIAFMGSQNMIDSSYLKPDNIKVGRHWKDLNIKISGEIVQSLEIGLRHGLVHRNRRKTGRRNRGHDRPRRRGGSDATAAVRTRLPHHAEPQTVLRTRPTRPKNIVPDQPLLRAR